MLLQPTDNHCSFCFDTLIHALASPHAHSHAHLNTTSFSQSSPTESYPMFVTWKKHRSNSLRGCLGTFNPTPLWIGLSRFALASALHDSRFSPIMHDEIPSLSVTVSLLGHFQEVSDWQDWQLGVNGISIKYDSDYTATFLPEVAVEWGWSKEQTIQQLLQKAGYCRTSYDVELLQVTKYESRIHSLAYSDYINSKK